MIKFEDDNPAEKYELIQDWTNPDAVMLISEVQKQFILSAKARGDDFVNFPDGTMVRINDIKKIKRAVRWQSAEEKKEEAKNSHISDLWWKYRHAIQENKLDRDCPFAIYLRDRLGKTPETIEKIRQQVKKSGADIEI